MNLTWKRSGDIAIPVLAFLRWAVITFALMWIWPWLIAGVLPGVVHASAGWPGLRDTVTSMATSDTAAWMSSPQVWAPLAWTTGAIVLARRVVQVRWTQRQIEWLGAAADAWATPRIDRLYGMSGRNLIALACVVVALGFVLLIAIDNHAHRSAARVTQVRPGQDSMSPTARRAPQPEAALRLPDGSIRSGRADIRQLPDGSYTVSLSQAR